MTSAIAGEKEMSTDGTYFKVVSLLMQYPDETYLAWLPKLQATVAQFPPGRRTAGIKVFLAHVEGCSLLDLQERYTAVFDLSPATTLNITYHLWGDGEKRTRLLSELQQAYASAGLEKTASELPDFLPLMLEYVAAVPGARTSTAIQTSFKGLAPVVARLHACAPPYAALLDPLAACFPALEEAPAATGADG